MKTSTKNKSDRLDLKNLHNATSSRLSDYLKGFHEKGGEKRILDKQVLLSTKLKDVKLRGYLDYQNPSDMLSSVQEQFIKLYDSELNNKKVVKAGFVKDNIPEAKKVVTKGKGWFNFRENESAEVERDYLMIKMRNAIDPKRFYKKGEHKTGIPKFIQVGTVLSDAHDFYDRATKAERKNTLVEEMLANVESKKKIKKRYAAVKPMIAKKRQRKAIIKKHQQRHAKKRNVKIGKSSKGGRNRHNN